MFISFEGLDSSGKTTQAQLLVDDFTKSGKEVLFLREPGGTEVSEHIRTILLDKRNSKLSNRAELLLFSAARAQLVAEVIAPALKAGKAVVCDRFFDSTTAYQGYGRGLDIEEVKALNRIAVGGTLPDLTLFVNVDLEEIRRRRKAAGVVADRMESSGNAFYQNVLHGYLAIAKAEPQRVRLIDGMRSVEAIHAEVWNIVRSRFSQLGEK
jgi:dTMP kinase